MIIYFGLGSNLGNRLMNLREALEKLKAIGKIIKSSSVYSSSAWGGVPQPDYLNACVKLEAYSDTITPPELLKMIKNYEHELGRVPSVRWGARKIDIDILLIDDEVYNSPELNIPHISMTERMFVLVPLMELLPSDWKHPVNQKGIQEIIAAVHDEYPLRITEL